MILNNNNTDDEESQSNFEKVKELLHVIWKIEMTPLARRFLLYQIDQQYGYIKNGVIKNGDSVSLPVVARQFGMNNYQNITDAITELQSMNIMFVDRKKGIRNKYDINEDIQSWII